MALHRVGREHEADEHYAMVLSAEPGHAQALRLRGILARDTGRLPLAVELLRKAVEAAPHDPEAAAELGLSHLASGHLQLAEAAFLEALDRDPASRKALTNLGAVLQHQGHLAPAIDVYRELLAMAPDDLEVRCNLAQTLLEAGRGVEALQACDEALCRAPGHATVLATRGAILCALERHAEALPVLEATLESPLESSLAGESADMPLINLAVAARALGHRERAIAALITAIRNNADNARAVADLTLLWAGDGHADDALTLSADFLQRHPGERLVLAARAVALRESGREIEARALIDLQGLVAIRDHLVCTVEEADRWHAELAALIRADPSLLASPTGKSTRGGAQTGEFNPHREPLISSFQERIDAAIRTIVADFRQAGLADHPAMAWATEAWTLRMWATVLPPGGHQLPHMHPLGWLSGVYYVQVPAGIGGTDAGALEFGALPDWICHRQPPERRVIRPIAGRLVVFPSYLHHRTLPFTAGDQPRISIAFDVMPAFAGPPSQGG